MTRIHFFRNKHLMIIAFVMVASVFRLTLFHAYVLFNAGNISLNFAYISGPSISQENVAWTGAFLERAVALNPASPNIWRNYGYALLMNGEVDEAIKAWQLSSFMPYEIAFYCERTFENQQYNETSSWIDYGVELAPEYGDWFYYRGLLLKESDETDQALNTLLQGLDWPLLALSKSDIYFQTGLLHQQKDTSDIEQALNAFNRAIEIADFSKSQNEINAHFERGEILRRLGRNEDAIEDYEWVIMKQPGDYWSHVALGILYWQFDKDIELGRDMLKTAVSIRPDLSRAYEWLGRLYLAQGQTQEAILIYQHVLDIDPSNSEAIRQIGELLPSD